MRKKSRVIAAAVVVVFLGGLGWLVWRTQPPPDQMWRGHKMTEELSHLQSSVIDNNALVDATNMLRELGTNALPTLVRMVRAHDSPLQRMLLELAKHVHFITVQHVDTQQLNNEAYQAFRIMGPKAAGAVPALIKIFNQRLSFSSQYTAAISLAAIGPEARAAVPSLVRQSSSTNELIRNGVYWALGDIHASPEVAVPVLIRGLSDPFVHARPNAARGLGNFGPEAKAAVPALVTLIKKEKIPPVPATAPVLGLPALFDTYMESLRKIDPEAATKVMTELLDEKE